jgi:chaperonin GroEL (HSP60 family)
MDEFDQMLLALQTIGEFFTTSLGPKGLDKLVYDAFDNQLIVSNDGSTILKSLEDIIAPKYSNFLLKWGKIIAENEGDGLKTFYILLGAILGECQKLKEQNILSANLIDTILLMQQQWMILKTELSFLYPSEQITSNSLQQYLMTGLIGRFSKANCEHLASITSQLLLNLSVDKNLTKNELKSSIHFQYLSGSFIKDSRIFYGTIISKEPANFSLYPPEGYYNANIVLIRAKLYFDLPKKGDEQNSAPYELTLTNPQQIIETQKFKKEFAIKWGDKIKSLGCNIVVTEKGVDNNLEQFLTLNNILLIRRVKPEEIRLLADYFQIPIIERVEEISAENCVIIPRVIYKKIGKDNFFLFDSLSQNGNKSRFNTLNAVTILIGGPTYYICQEVERFLYKLLVRGQEFRVHHRYFLGGGNIEMRFGLELLKIAEKTGDIRGHILKQIALKFFRIPELLAQSSGQELLDIFITYKKAIIIDPNCCLDVNSGQIIINPNPSFFDSYSGKDFLYSLLFETLLQLLRIDRMIQKRRKVQ